LPLPSGVQKRLNPASELLGNRAFLKLEAAILRGGNVQANLY